MSTFKYDFAISFAGEQRNLASELYEKLKSKGAKVFIDEDPDTVVELWGGDLSKKFWQVYSKDARYFIPFISKEYEVKSWPGYEFQNAVARFIEQKGDYILPVRVDDTELPGLPSNIGYLDIRNYSITQIADIAIKKLSRKAEKPAAKNKTESSTRGIFHGRIPQVKREFTQREQVQFMKKAFEYMARHIMAGLEELGKTSETIETDFEELDKRTITGTIYINGKIKQSFRLWYGDNFSKNAIYYKEGTSGIGRANSYNEIIYLEPTDGELLLKPMMMGHFGMSSGFEKNMNKERLFEYFWERIIHPLEY